MDDDAVCDGVNVQGGCIKVVSGQGTTIKNKGEEHDHMWGELGTNDAIFPIC
jgi:hypothetical protein